MSEIIESKFLIPLDGRWIDDERFMLLSDLQYQSALLGGVITVPKGFVTDFASVPRVPFIYEAFGDRAHHESVVHDFLYQTHEIPLEVIVEVTNEIKIVITLIGKAKADYIFKEAMICRKKPFYIYEGMYIGVVLGGASSYASGPKRFKILNPES